MTRDDGWDDSELDAFALGAADENGMRRDGDVGERARRMMRDRMVGKRMEAEA